jgi:hypothetical protein
MSDLSPLSGEERKLDFGAVRSVDGPLTDLGSSSCHTVVDFAAESHKVDGLCQERCLIPTRPIENETA